METESKKENEYFSFFFFEANNPSFRGKKTQGIQVVNHPSKNSLNKIRLFTYYGCYQTQTVEQLVYLRTNLSGCEISMSAIESN